MTKLTVGSKLPAFDYATVYESGLHIYDTLAKADKTALVFLRYYGCPFCQLDMHEYETHYSEITAHGGQFLVVLQSDPARLKEKLEGHTFPFTIICDPEMKLYKEFEIQAGKEMKDIAGPGVPAKALKVKKLGYTHGDYEGIETQLPATFAITKDGTVTCADYPAYVEQSATAEQLIEILK